MDQLDYYGSSDEDTSHIAQSSIVKINAAPDAGFGQIHSDRLYTAPTATELTVNVPYQDMQQPLLGPSNPYRKPTLPTQNILTGHVEQQAMNESDFRTQLRTYETYGYARDPSTNTAMANGNVGHGLDGSGYVGNLETAMALQGATVYDRAPKAFRRNQEQRKKRNGKGDAGVLEGDNAYKGPWAGYDDDDFGHEAPKPDEEQQEETQEEEEPTTALQQIDDEDDETRDKAQPVGNETTKFHGKQQHDYLGRTYMAIPQDLDINLSGEPGSQHCFIPKTKLHTWSGHKGGASAIRFFPQSGHLLLSCGMDNKVKLWDVYHDRSLLRSYMGHTKAVRDIAFDNTGSRFLSAGYDRFVKLWDTETGQCIRSFSTGKIPYCVTFNPSPNLQHVFLAGYSDKKIKQFDVRSGKMTQEYDQHLGAINTITFVDNNRRFISTSDDKTMRAWEFDIPVVIKYIAEPDMHSMPAVSLHPNRKWIACQSLDNQILIYGAQGRFKANTKKSFRGHMVAGYACKPGFSADGRFLSSGDASGNVFVWDWKTSKILKKFKAHNKVVMNTEWHPHETSKMATCSWDGFIHYWD
ncbi:WD40 repeat-like protein [Hesseltinella vesiculosa]|uniref:Pre-mRNA-processing factor 17 n=1 Tax=Hesseltinella vesiculosa TaxID=101127 RepID=A0A1X2G7K9_9FUNG|nr:WD40 repeat-like protein [Hesseltinella vesiculosa]